MLYPTIIANINDNDEYIYSRGDIESTIVQKYIEYFNGEIEVDKQYNRIVVKLPKKHK